MTERIMLLTATTAILAVLLAYNQPRVGRRLGRGGLLCVLAGTLTPLLDYPLLLMRSADRIEYLAQPRLFHGLFGALLLLGGVAVLIAMLHGSRHALRSLGLALYGLALYDLLLALTPAGAPLLEPFSPYRVALPVFPAGHLLPLLILAAALVLNELARRWRRAVMWSAAGMLVAYVAAGTGQYVFLRIQGAMLAPPERAVSVAPDGAWLSRWIVVVRDDNTYRPYRYDLWEGDLRPAESVARWNDEARMLRLLDDPIVYRFFHYRFDHPVARVDVSDSQLSLIVQELRDQSPPVPGRTLYFETDGERGERVYRLQRFD